MNQTHLSKQSGYLQHSDVRPAPKRRRGKKTREAAAKRQAAWRERQRAQGYVYLAVYLLPSQVATLRSFATIHGIKLPGSPRYARKPHASDAAPPSGTRVQPKAAPLSAAHVSSEQELQLDFGAEGGVF